MLEEEEKKESEWYVVKVHINLWPFVYRALALTALFAAAILVGTVAVVALDGVLTSLLRNVVL